MSLDADRLNPIIMDEIVPEGWWEELDGDDLRILAQRIIFGAYDMLKRYGQFARRRSLGNVRPVDGDVMYRTLYMIKDIEQDIEYFSGVGPRVILSVLDFDEDEISAIIDKYLKEAPVVLDALREGYAIGQQLRRLSKNGVVKR